MKIIVTGIKTCFAAIIAIVAASSACAAVICGAYGKDDIKCAIIRTSRTTAAAISGITSRTIRISRIARTVRADSSRDRTAVRISSRTSRTISIRTDADIFFSKGIRNTCSKGITYALFIPL